MPKIAIISIALFLAALSCGGYFLDKKLPSLARQQTISALSSIGFKDVTLTEFEARISAARFKNIALDPEGFSTIKRLEVRYSPLSLILGTQPNSIIIDGLDLTGELSQSGDITISGWSNNDTSLALQNSVLKTLTIQDSTISLLTENHGGIDFNYSLQTHIRDQQIEFQAHATSRQKSLSFIANAKGYINKNGSWQADIEIGQGKFELAPVKVSRLNGKINVLSAKNEPPKIVSELRAGGINLHGLPWQSVSATLEGVPGNYQISADMKSVGFEGLELSLNLKHENGSSYTSGQIYAEKLKTLTKYLSSHNLEPFSEDHLKQLERAKDLNIDFIYKEQSIIFNIKDTDQGVDITDSFALTD